MTEREIKTPELPKGWTYTSLGEVLIRLSNGITQKQGTTGIPVTRIETISKGTIDLERVGYLDGLSPETILKYKLICGDMLFSHINSDAHLGKTAIFHMADTRLLHGMNLLLIRANQDIINSNYLNFLMNYYRFSGVFFTIAQHAVNQSSINQAKLNALSIPLPPLSEQHRIVTKIEELITRLDTGVDALKKIQIQLKRYRQSVLKSAFNGELTAEWRKAHQGELEPASALLEKIKEERKKSSKYKELPPLDTADLPQLPGEWVWARVGDITWFKNGINFTSGQKGDKGIQTIDVLNMYSPNIRIKLDDIYRVDTIVGNEHILRNGDILFVRSSVKHEGVGWASLFSTDMKQPATYCGFIIRARLYCDLVSPEYLTYVLRTDFWRRLIIDSSSQVTITNINQNSLSKIIVPLPCFTEQQKIVEEIERLFSITDEIETMIQHSLKQANRLRQSILKKAFEGKLVSQNPDDEPAEKLLERIKVEKAKNRRAAINVR